jgi:hypothetical protein
MKFFCELRSDRAQAPDDLICFEVEATSAHEAMLLIGAYNKGRFEASGVGAEVERLAKTKARGVEYRRL